MRNVHTHDKTPSLPVLLCGQHYGKLFLEGLAWAKLQGKGCLGDQRGMLGGAPPPSPPPGPVPGYCSQCWVCSALLLFMQTPHNMTDLQCGTSL